jgi:hemerythrin-like metal-binding protein
MRTLLISSAFSGLTQRFYTELEDAGYIVSVELHLGDDATVLEGVSLFKPDLILCPFLTKRLSKDIYQNYKCLIVHPGIKGDRGPSSLDWAIQNGEPEWGVSLLEAAEEMDAGAIWANKTFPLRQATKSSIFYREVTQAAIDCLWEVLTYFDAPDFNPDIQDYRKPGYTGKLQPSIKQTDRAINWKTHKTDDILRRINAADGSPGVLDEIYGTQVFLFNAHKDCQLTGKPGEIIATANHAICRATIDGAIWIGHLQPKLASGAKGIKLPALFVLKDLMPKTVSSLKALLSKTIKPIDIDYSKPGRQLPCQEIWYELDTDVAYLYFPFHNGGMSTEQCRLLLTVYQHVATLPVKAIVLMGGEESWSNGIHLNHIEAAASPADESWLNINAIDDLIYQIITTLDKLTISAVAGYDESLKALATYRKFELTQMYANFYGNDNYHSARQNFVFKTSNDKSTPANLARHRQQEGQAKKLSLGSMYHFVWQDFYQMNDALIDSQHQELFHLANQLVASASKEELTSNIKLIVQHVTEHFDAEEELMAQLDFKNCKGHVREHQVMLEKLAEINQKIANDDWIQNDIQEFIDKWGKHIINSDMAFNVYQKKQEFEPVG